MHKSILGNIYFLAGRPISWSAKQQPIPANQTRRGLYVSRVFLWQQITLPFGGGTTSAMARYLAYHHHHAQHPLCATDTDLHDLSFLRDAGTRGSRSIVMSYPIITAPACQ